ncbi:MAG: nickel-dependent hydrogenase large subunit, partial [Pseudomonadota bacterium]
YLDALDIRTRCHKMAALFAGKMPHSTTLVPGGVTEHVTVDKIAAYASMLKEVRTFVATVYLPDVIAVAQAFDPYFSLARGCGNFLAFGVFPEGSGTWLPPGTLFQGQAAALNTGAISEEVARSWFSADSGGPPASGHTIPAPDKRDAYTWLKAPRYNGKVMEVGPLARMLVAYQAGQPEVRSLVDKTLARLGKQPQDLDSVMGRHAARALEALLVADRCAGWVERLRPGNPCFTEFTIPERGNGIGLTEAPRGALGHWLTVEDGKIGNYQCVVPTTWNCSPRDAQGTPGPVEQALVGTPIADEKNPIEAARVVRSFDPCLACAVH